MRSAIDISGIPAGEEVDSFVILPPTGARYEAALREVEGFLRGCFPEFDFIAVGQTTHFQGDYQVVHLRVVGDHKPGAQRSLPPPDQLVMMDITAALKAFRPGHAPALN